MIGLLVDSELKNLRSLVAGSTKLRCLYLCPYRQIPLRIWIPFNKIWIFIEEDSLVQVQKGPVVWVVLKQIEGSGKLVLKEVNL